MFVLCRDLVNKFAVKKKKPVMDYHGFKIRGNKKSRVGIETPINNVQTTTNSIILMGRSPPVLKVGL
jgi:hypothetical protein